MAETNLQSKTVAELKQIAKECKIDVPSGIRKAELIALIEGAKSEASAKLPNEPVTVSEGSCSTAAAGNSKESEIKESTQPAGDREQRRFMSTQQRMGARTQPVQNYRTPQPRTPVRGNGDAPQRRMPTNGRVNDGRNLIRRPVNENENGEQINRQSEPDRIESSVTRSQLTTEGTFRTREYTARSNEPTTQRENAYNGEFGEGEGILEIHQDGYGFLRAENCLPGNHDAYVSAAQIRRFNLRTGDHVKGKTRPQQAENQSDGLMFITEVNGEDPEKARFRKPFDQLIPVYPNQRFRLSGTNDNDPTLRLIDIIAPIGKGQRGMIVAQPKAGKTTILKKIANAISANAPEAHLIVLLIDERPEEVTDMKRSISGEVIYSTFDEAPENHARVSEMVLERAQRLVEQGKDVVILLDSITRLARAYNLVIPPTGRSLSGGLDPGALYRPKRFFGAARNIENGGSLTIIATALVDTGSRMDDIIFEEFKGTGNMELHLDRSLSERRIFPAVDVFKSGTRREDLLLTPEELEGAYETRRMLSKGNPQETCEQLISFILKTKDNAEYYRQVKNWMHAFDKNPRK